MSEFTKPRPVASHVQSLDGLRGICAGMVALMHLRIYSHLYALPLVRQSWLFVDFFFVLSGFVIALVYRHQLHNFADAARFTLRRLGRLWPLHVTVLMAMICIEGMRYLVNHHGLAVATRPAFSGQYDASTILPNFLLLHALRLHQLATWNGASWSISTEFYTYLVFAAVCMAFRRRLIAISLLLAAASALAIGLFSPTFMQTEGQAIVDGVTVPTSDFTWLRCLYGFFTGVITHRLWSARKTEPAGWMEIAVTAVVIAFVSWSRLTAWTLLAPLVFALVVGIFACEQGLVSRLLKSKPLVRIGHLSYSLYMVHVLVFSLLASEQSARILARFTGFNGWTEMTIDGKPVTLLSLGTPWLGDLMVLAVAIVLLAVSALTYNLVEQPGRKFFNRLARRSAGAKAAPARTGA